MKAWIRTTIFALGMIGAVAVGTAQAQLTDPIRFTTTFPFAVGHVTLPAGSYTVRPLDDMLGVMAISNGRRTEFFDTMDAGVRNPAKVKDEVVFRKTGDQYVLSEILDASDRGGVEIPKTAAAEPRRNHRAH